MFFSLSGFYNREPFFKLILEEQISRFNFAQITSKNFEHSIFGELLKMINSRMIYMGVKICTPIRRINNSINAGLPTF